MDEMNIQKIHIGKLIKQKMDEQQRSVAWLAREIKMDSSYLNKQLKSQAAIHTALLYRISIALKTDFFAYYSQRLLKDIR